MLSEGEKKAIDCLKIVVDDINECGAEYYIDKDMLNDIQTLLNLIEKLKKEITNGMEREENLKDSLMEIIETLNLENNVIGQETILREIIRLQTENEELKEKVFKRDKELIRLEEYANKNFERKDDVKARYIPKDKIREKIKELEEEAEICRKEGCENTEDFDNCCVEILKELLEEE